ncbi:hypothetical protein [Clostridium sporogenes]|uniref:hypothetical protein n=1 Tax=Clostridium sporogenes TaxID=1509 RepID=UPI0007177D42|nr:hypothetical protein [Clostridium sporogenes]KRU40057.1 hypothetical protein VT94_25340 [Clostridium sporogenes]MBY7065204.1 hypothetical protein [Clostridium sporogenes]MBY7071826.1 hypothetical protein [Clostridium sporogenes]MCW6064726.1 hypothetical protein [Clostridium sporogenes]OQP88545.1 hypothetical protein VT93_0201890 [Clostridium sporogenes]
MNQKTGNEYMYKKNNNKYLKGAAVLALGLLSIIVLIKWVFIPLSISFIKWVVPNFWTHIGYIIILWIMYKIFSLLWTPIRSIFGKWSYLILIATIIYIILQIV